MFHHGLIKLVISIVLRKRENTWDYFLFWSGFQIEKEDQAQKRQLNKGQNLVKKLKKKVTVKNEEDSETGKSMNQEDENVKIEQQINIEENKVSNSEVKEMELVENAFPLELNQGVREDVKEQEQVPITVLSEEEERSLSNEASVHIKHDIHTHSKEETMSRGRKMKVVELASITRQGKVLKMLG